MHGSRNQYYEKYTKNMQQVSEDEERRRVLHRDKKGKHKERRGRAQYVEREMQRVLQKL
jgi:hypothetical protein